MQDFLVVDTDYRSYAVYHKDYQEYLRQQSDLRVRSGSSHEEEEEVSEEPVKADWVDVPDVPVTKELTTEWFKLVDEGSSLSDGMLYQALLQNGLSIEQISLGSGTNALFVRYGALRGYTTTARARLNYLYGSVELAKKYMLDGAVFLSEYGALKLLEQGLWKEMLNLLHDAAALRVEDSAENVTASLLSDTV